MAPARMSAEARRESILDAAMPLFAELGLRGVTTRQIADAAGISEALLYRHFDGKEALYEEIQRSCLRQTTRVAEQLTKLEPSTSTLVLALHYMMSQVFFGAQDASHTRCLKRLIINSLLEDGAFVRGFLQANIERWLPVLEECMEAAHQAGELVVAMDTARARLWFCHHLAAILTHYRMPEKPVIDYGLQEEELLEEAVRFALRGLGLSDEAIASHYNPKALALLTQNLSQQIS